MTSQEKYIQKLDDMFASAVSVVFTPSREPRRTVEAVKAMGARDNVPVFVWNDVYGWARNQFVLTLLSRKKSRKTKCILRNVM